MIKDQAKRFKAQLRFQLHMGVAKSLSLMGFSILGLLVGMLFSPIFGTAGIIYQICQVLILLARGLCSSREVREEDDFNVLESKSPSHGYQSPASPLSKSPSARQSSQGAPTIAGNNYSNAANQMSFSFDLKQVQLIDSNEDEDDGAS